MTELVLIRHGSTVWNEERRFQGQLDSELSATGRQQAQALAPRLAQMGFAKIYSSDLKRCMDTAHYTAESTGHQIHTDRRLRERNMGIFEGLTAVEIEERYPEEFEKFAARDPAYKVPDGESSNDLQRRAARFFNEAAALHEGERVLFFTHGGVIHTFFHYVFELPLGPWRRLSNHNTGINIFVVKDGRWQLGTYGDIGHLEDA